MQVGCSGKPLSHPLAGHGPEAAAFSAGGLAGHQLAAGSGATAWHQGQTARKNGLPLALLLRRAV